jgi:hypothetical protein
MALFSPGAETLLTYTFRKGMSLAAGIRAYLPYSNEGGTHASVANQGLVSWGYSF